MKRSLPALALTIAACAGAARHPAIGPEPAVVSLMVTVTDAQHRFVPGLVAADFEIFDNNTPRPIVAFDAARRPAALLLMIDTSASMQRFIRPMHEAAAQLLSSGLRPDDLARVAAITQKTTLSPRFTRDRAELVAAISAMGARGSTYLWDGLAAGIDAIRDGVGNATPNDATHPQIVVVTDGGDTESVLSADEIVRRTRTRGVTVHVVELPDLIRPRAGGDRDLRNLADDSGGGYIRIDADRDGRLDPSQLGLALTRLGEELHSQYVMAFRPVSADSRVHRLAVHVRRSGLEARARRTYVPVPSPGRP